MDRDLLVVLNQQVSLADSVISSGREFLTVDCQIFFDIGPFFRRGCTIKQMFFGHG